MAARTVPSPVATLLLAVALSFAFFPGCKPAPKPVSDTGKAAPPPAGKEAEQETAHASLAAYPGAVISCTDAASGTTFEVAPDGRTLLAKNADGQETLRVDVIEKCGSPAVGAPVIRHLAVTGTSLGITFGKHSAASVDLKSMTLTCEGSD
jgi:hypothetical protein